MGSMACIMSSPIMWLERINAPGHRLGLLRTIFFQAPAGTQWYAVVIQTHWGEHLVLSKDGKERGEREAATLLRRDA